MNNIIGVKWGIFYYTFSVRQSGKICITANCEWTEVHIDYEYTLEECQRLAETYMGVCPVYRKGLKFYEQVKES